MTLVVKANLLFFTEIEDNDNDEWEEEDLLPLLPPGSTFRNFVDFDNNVATENTNLDNCDELLQFEG
jgi:hypothetical protein